MQAVVLREVGPPSVLAAADVDDPVPGPGEVVVEVHYAGVTFVETQVRAGRGPNPALVRALPAVLGNGVGGLVVAVGPDVEPRRLGNRVVGSTGGSGGYAELARVRVEDLVAVPDGLALDEAVALLADGRTALALLRTAPVGEGRTVLVEAAAGGVGSLLVQLAHGRGARVVAAAGSEEKLRVAKELGADVLVDYRDRDWSARVRDEVGGVDVVFDGVGGAIGAAAFALVRDGGRFCAFGLASGTWTEIPTDDAAGRGIEVIRGARLAPGESPRLSAQALAEAAAGRLRPVIGQRVPLERAADAHAAIEARSTIGKTLLVTAAAAPR